MNFSLKALFSLKTLLATAAILTTNTYAEDSSADVSSSSDETNASAIVPDDAICLNQEDFSSGTKIIDAPGIYKLCSDITFGPNGPQPNEVPSETAFDPDLSNYAENEFGLGFFTALAIAADDVTLYLNGHTIEQSAGHALMQRFFAVIELASSPFIPGVGPAQFVSNNGTAYSAANNVNILGPGVIGRSSHHGIHGNENTNVKITGVTFQDFEVAAVSLNNVDGLEIIENTISGNRKDVPVVGLFSAARFIRPYAKYLKDMNYTLTDENGTAWKTAEQAYDDLITSINNVYEDVIYNGGSINSDTHPVEHHLFDNPHRVVDGPCYALLVHGKGPAVGGMGEVFNEIDPTTTSSNIVIQDNIIDDIKCWNNEVPALFGDCGHHGCIQNDPRGAVFQTVKTFDSDDPYLSINEAGEYIGNVVADMQLIVAAAILDGTLSDMPARQIGPNSINQDLIDWATNGGSMTPQYVCNGDSMHHVVKGITVVRVEDTEGFDISGNIITNIENLSPPEFDDCYDFHIGASIENVDEQQGCNVRAISVAATRGYTNKDSIIKKNYIGDVSSAHADMVVGIDIQGDSQDITLKLNEVDLQDTDSIVLTQEEASMLAKTFKALTKAVRKGTRNVLNSENLEEAQNLYAEKTAGSDVEYVALRIRENTSDINLTNNNFLQPVENLNTARVRGRARKLSHAPHPHVSGDIEWKSGGCPFHDDYANIIVDPIPF